MKKYRIAMIPGDGVGKEVLAEGEKVLRAVQKVQDEFTIAFAEFPWGCDFYQQHGQMMPDDALQVLKEFDALYLGAVGDPSVPDHVSLWGLLLPIRKSFDQYVNLRPIQLLSDDLCPIKDKQTRHVDILFVRENTEGEYSGIGQIFNENTENEQVTQTSVFSRKGTERIIRYAFDRAMERRMKITAVTKSNALNYSMVYWDRLFKEIAAEYPLVETRLVHVDAMAMYMIRNPEQFDVVVASNLFGDILTDLGAAIQGGMGYAAGGNINPENAFPSMFEPIHGSAPDIAGTGQANPIASIWAASMMMAHLGETKAAKTIFQALKKVTADRRYRTPDSGGSATTAEVGSAVVSEIEKQF